MDEEEEVEQKEVKEECAGHLKSEDGLAGEVKEAGVDLHPTSATPAASLRSPPHPPPSVATSVPSLFFFFHCGLWRANTSDQEQR